MIQLAQSKLAPLIAIAMVAWAGSCAAAEVEYTLVTANGQDAVREKAIQAALIEALSQVSGAEVTSDDAYRLTSVEVIKGRGAGFESEEEFSRRVTTATRGLVRSWRLVREEKRNGLYVVELEVKVGEVVGAGTHETRRTLMVLPFRVSHPVSVLDHVMTPDSLGRQIQESTLTYLTQSRKFAVVDASFEQELQVRADTGGSVSEQAERALEAAKRLRAEYVAVGMADGIGITEAPRKSLLGEEPVQVRRATGLVQLRVIRVATRQTVLAASFNVAEMESLRLDGPKPELFVFETLGRRISARILETIYPPKVAAINGPDEVVVNRGGESFEVGQQFEVFNLGNEITDPSTGESLGRSERKVGLLEISRVLPKVCYARVLEAKEPIRLEAVCRLPQKPQKPADPPGQTEQVKQELERLFR